MFNWKENALLADADGVIPSAAVNQDSSRVIKSLTSDNTNADLSEIPALPPIDENYLPPDDRRCRDMVDLGWTVQDDNTDCVHIYDKGAPEAATVSNRGSHGTSHDREAQMEEGRRPSVKEGWLVETLFELKNTAPSVAAGTNNTQSVKINSSNKNDERSYPDDKNGTLKSDMAKSTTIQTKSEITWNQRLNELLDFKAQHGHCNVPQKYEKNSSLGAWVARNRLLMRQWESNNLSCSPYQAERMQTLKDVGLLSGIGKQCLDILSTEMLRESDGMTEVADDDFHTAGKGGFAKSTGVFLSSRNAKEWETQFNNLQIYKTTHGNCDVPVKSDQHKSLGRWVSAQRRKYQQYFSRNSSEVKPSNDLIQRFKRLDDIGFNFSIGSGNAKRQKSASQLSARPEYDPFVDQSKSDANTDLDHGSNPVKTAGV